MTQISHLPFQRPDVGWCRLRAQFLDGLLSVRCAGCNARGAALCATCRFALLDASRRGLGAVAAGPDAVIAAVEFTGRARSVIHGLKYQNRRAVITHLAGLLAGRLRDVGIRPGIDITAVTWAPTHGARRRERGYDQAELLARATARVLGVPAVRLLDRVDRSGPQTGRTRLERESAPAFTGRRSRHQSVLLIDDVVTTGSTLAAASGALRTAGVRRVVCSAVAATPVQNRRKRRAPLSTAA
jgi:predicted amidophosphoribosyltransferase